MCWLGVDEFVAEDGPGLGHEWIAMASSLEDAGFPAARTVADSTGGQAAERVPQVVEEVLRIDQAPR